jgi:hypothetical protein
MQPAPFEAITYRRSNPTHLSVVSVSVSSIKDDPHVMSLLQVTCSHGRQLNNNLID